MKIDIADVKQRIIDKAELSRVMTVALAEYDAQVGKGSGGQTLRERRAVMLAVGAAVAALGFVREA